MIGSDSVTNDFAFEELSYLGKTKNTLCFQHFAMLPHPPNACQMQSKTRGGKPSPLHNYHLSIFSFGPMHFTLVTARIVASPARKAQFVGGVVLNKREVHRPIFFYRKLAINVKNDARRYARTQ